MPMPLLVTSLPRRRGWTHAGLKLQLLTQGGDACSLKRRSERNIFYKYYAEEGPDDDYDSFGELDFFLPIYLAAGGQQ